MKKIISLSVILFLFTCIFYGQTPEESNSDITNGAKKGEEVGNFVKSLIDTALPVWGSISKVIWPDGKPTSKARKKDADEAMAKSEEELQKEIKGKLIDEAKKKISPIEALSDELSVVYRISQAGIFAQKDLADLTTELNKEEIDWSESRELLKDLKDVLIAMDGVTDVEIYKKVDEKSLQLTLINIKTDKNRAMRRLEGYLSESQKDKVNAIKKINDLRKDFQSIDRLTAGYLFQIYNDLKALSLWTNNAMSVYETPENPMFKELKELLPIEN